MPAEGTIAGIKLVSIAVLWAKNCQVSPCSRPQGPKRGSRGIELYSSMTLAPDGGGWSSRPGRLYPLEWAGTHCTGGWVGPRAGLDRCGKSCPHRDSIPGPSSPWRVATPTTLFQPKRNAREIMKYSCSVLLEDNPTEKLGIIYHDILRGNENQDCFIPSEEINLHMYQNSNICRTLNHSVFILKTQQ